jgi:hypothetical protein
MAISVQRDAFDDNFGFCYYVSFKPALPGEEAGEDVCARVPVETKLSLSETGDLADFSFVLPKPCRSELAITFIRRQQEARISSPQVHIAVPGTPGDALTDAVGSLELDLAGRIIGMSINWIPGMATC